MPQFWTGHNGAAINRELKLRRSALCRYLKKASWCARKVNAYKNCLYSPYKEADWYRLICGAFDQHVRKIHPIWTGTKVLIVSLNGELG